MRSSIAKLQSKTKLSAKVYPCGFFSVYEQKKQSKEEKPGPGMAQLWDEKVCMVQREIPGISASDASAIVGARVRAVRSALRDSSGRRPNGSLDLTRPAISRENPKPRLPRGFHGLSSYAKRLTYSSVEYMERRYGKDQLSFLTLTLPSLEEADLQAIQKSWSKIVNRFTDELSRKLKSRGLPGEVVGAVEIQEQRFTRTGQEVPHLHIVFVGRMRKRSWAVCPKELKRQWSRTIKSVTGITLNMSGSVDLKRVKKSAARYISKYLSKGRTNSASDRLTGEVTSFVSAWYLCSLSLRRMYDRAIVKSPVVAVQILEWIRENNPEVTWKKTIVEYKDGGTFVPCIHGFLRGTTKELVTQLMSPA